MNIKNKFIAIEGLDGAGKSTQIDLLIKHLEKENIPTKFIHFPRHNKGIFGALISRFLRGEFGAVDNVHPQLVALLFAEDRKDFAASINQWLVEGYFVLVDRYVISNIAYQCAKLTDTTEKETLKTWINTFEYDYNKIPKPDLSIYLEVPFDFTLKSLTHRQKNEARHYLKGQNDIHEADFGLQLAVKQEYDNILKTDNSITCIHCSTVGNEMRTIQDIHREIVMKLK